MRHLVVHGIFDQNHLLTNAPGLKNDLEGNRVMPDGKVSVKLLVLNG